MSLATSLSLENFGEFSASKMGASSGKAQKLSQIQVLNSLAKYNKKFSALARIEVKKSKDIVVQEAQKFGRRQSMLQLGGGSSLEEMQ